MRGLRAGGPRHRPGRLAPSPAPHGLRLHGVRVTGRLDLENATGAVPVDLPGSPGRCARPERKGPCRSRL
ncbi:hypothetical protein [Actinosynnema pretiosum]|uniref:hypothetical protein n=1 Tax=Actinosynnema pretiosum TaxID=42197 RepID=UPI0012FD3076|nr:hypothetical protein [Actinosynnema pretiosum]